MRRSDGLKALGLVVLMAFSAPTAEAKDREANHFEYAYSDLAHELPLPSLCEKISPRAYQTAARAPRGLQIFYTRSECYFTLARRTRNSDYCRHVRQKRGGLRFLSGGKISEAACRDGGKGSVGGTPIDYEPILRILGYTDADLDLPFIKGRKYLREIRRRLDELPDFTVNPPLDPERFSPQSLGCVGEEDPRWYCLEARCLMDSDEKFRQACLVIAQQLRYGVELRGYYKRLAKKYPELLEAHAAGIRALWEASHRRP